MTYKNIKATPHNHCVPDTPNISETDVSDFSSGFLNLTQEG